MKLIFAIMSDDDAKVVTSKLTKEHYQVTKLSSTGGFLRVGNTTLLIGTEPDKIDRVVEIIKKYSSERKEIVSNNIPFEGAEYMTVPVEIQVGGSVVFVVDVDQFYKL